MRRRCHRTAQGAESGFTLVELLISMFLTVLVMSSLLAFYVSGTATVVLAKQRQAATALSNQTIEQLRSLPYAVTTAGLTVSDTAGDSWIVAGRFRPAFDSTIDEQLVTTSASQPAPLQPHLSSTPAVNGVAYRIRTYVSLVSGATDRYWLTAAVQWKSAATHNVDKTIVSRTQLFSPTGCLLPTSHSFSAPCEPYYYANSGNTPASVTVSSGSSSPLVPGLAVNAASLAFTDLSEALQDEQVTVANGKATTSSASVTSTSGTTTTFGGIAATGSVDDDPSTSDASTDVSATTAPQVATPVASNGGNDTSISVTPMSSDTGSTSSSVAAAGSSCQNIDGASYATGLGCSSGTAQAAGSSGSIQLGLGTYAGRTLGRANLATASPPSAASKAVAVRFPGGGATRCQNATASCVAAGAKYTLGTVMLGGLPAGTDPADSLPSGYSGLIELTSWSATANAESGLGAAPAAAASATTIRYWNGHGYSTFSWGTTPPDTSTPIPPVSATYKIASGDTLNITITGSFTYGGVSSTQKGSAGCQPTPCSYEQTVTPPNVVLNYTVTRNGNPVTAFTVAANPGTVTAKTTYKPATNG